MTSRLISTRPETQRLLSHLLEAPDLVRRVRALAPADLQALVQGVGLEDMGEIISLISTEQLEELFDAELWRTDDGEEEQFDPRRFSLWLEVLLEAGEQAVVERLCALPRDFLCMAVSRAVWVFDLDSLAADPERDTEGLDDLERALESRPSEEWEEFRLMDRSGADFDILMTALLALDAEHHETLRAIVERCAALTQAALERHESVGALLDEDEALEDEVRGTRNERRARSGHVALADARAFLRLCARGLKYGAERDPITQAFFRESAERPAKAARASRNWAKHVRGAEVLPTNAELQHTVQVPPGEHVIGVALRLLSEQSPEDHQRRLGELAYLANVLVVASSAAPRSLRPVEAIEVALWLCGLGLDDADRNSTLASTLVDSVRHNELDRLFRAGCAVARDRQPPAPPPNTAAAWKLAAEVIDKLMKA